jgi:hypothetical protein
MNVFDRKKFFFFVEFDLILVVDFSPSIFLFFRSGDAGKISAALSQTQIHTTIYVVLSIDVSIVYRLVCPDTKRENYV